MDAGTVDATRSPPPGPGSTGSTRLWFPSIVPMALGVVLVAIAAVDEMRDGATASAAWIWACGLAFVTAGVALSGRTSERTRQKRNWPEIAGVAAILILAFVFVFPDLASTPFQVHGDEASIGLEARRILDGTLPDPFSVGWYDVPLMSFMIPAPFLHFLGDDLFALRLASMIQGVGSVLLLYLLAKRLFSIRVAFIASFLLAVAHWHVHYSRTGFHYMQAIFATLLLFWLFERGIQRRDRITPLLAGFAAGLCLVVYYAARLAPVILLVWVLYRAFSERSFIPRYRNQLALFACGAVLFAAPFAIFYKEHPGALTSRTDQVFLLNKETLALEYGKRGLNRLEDVVAAQTRETLLAFNKGGDKSFQYGNVRPLLDRWTAPLMVLGLVLLALRFRRSNYFLLGIWVALTLLFGAILTIDAPFSPRMVIVLPALILVAALAIDAILSAVAVVAGSRARVAMLLTFVVLGGLIASANHREYFDRFATEPHRYDAITEASFFMDRLPPDSYVLFLNGTESIAYETPRFLSPNVRGEDRSSEFGTPGLSLEGVEGRPVFILMGAYLDRLEELQAKYPGGETIVGSGNPANFVAYIPAP
jgi:hypothetical protein